MTHAEHAVQKRLWHAHELGALQIEELRILGEQKGC